MSSDGQEHPTHDGNQRLPGTVVPRRYALDLTLDPAGDALVGVLNIDVDFTAPSALVHMHGHQLDVQSAMLFRDGFGETVEVDTGNHGALLLTAAEPIPAGPARISLRWTAKVTEVPEGLYRVRQDGVPYLFSQFEPVSARRVFPCFDEPAYKATYAVTLRVPEGQAALTNARCESSTVDAESGLVVHRFAETPPLPTYLIAFAVGPLELVCAPEGVASVPLRVVATRGQGHLAAYALAHTPAILAALEDWFGLPYPYDKLDLVAVPNFAAGAMENAGLVTFRERLVLLEDDSPAHDRMWAQLVIAHELAHMWFGDLVTMRWWDDLWLNEAFATWMETIIVQQVAPEFDAALEARRDAQMAMDEDALARARAVRQPIEHGGDILNAFDSITYTKGAALVGMVEGWLTPPVFQAGVRAYMNAHAHGNADTADLLGALEQAAERPVGATLSAFLDQPGTPEIDLHLTGRTLSLTQRRYRPCGGEAAEGEPWAIPMVVRLGGPDGVVTHTLTIDGREATVELPFEPRWIHPNAEAKGYYRWTLPEDALERLLVNRSALTVAERVTLPQQLRAQLESGALPPQRFLASLAHLAEDDHRLVVLGIIDALRRLWKAVLEEADRPVFSAFVRRVLGPHTARVTSAASDDAAVHLLREPLLLAMAEMGDDPVVRASLRDEAARFLADVGSGDAETARYALRVAAWDGDEDLLGRLRAALAEAPTPSHRLAAVSALGSFGDPTIAQAVWTLFLGEEIRAQDLFTLLRGSLRRTATRDALWDWLDAHYDAVVDKVGAEMAAALPTLGAGFSDAAGHARLTAFFEPEARRKPGTDRTLEQALEGIERRMALRGAVGEGVRAFLHSRGDAR